MSIRDLGDLWETPGEEPGLRAGTGGALLEDALETESERVAPLVKQASRLLSALKAWGKAADYGHTANRDKASAQARSLAAELSIGVAEAADQWGFDVRQYLESGRWREEIRTAAAEQLGLKTIPEGDYLLSPPVVVRALPASSALRLGKIRWQSLRPRVVAGELKRLREGALTGASQDFLESLYQAARRKNGSTNPFILFREAYELFCIAPGYKKENSKADFGLSIYALHKSATNATRSGVQFQFEWPAAKRKESDVFTVIAEDGSPLRYYGIQFAG